MWINPSIIGPIEASKVKLMGLTLYTATDVSMIQLIDNKRLYIEKVNA